MKRLKIENFEAPKTASKKEGTELSSRSSYNQCDISKVPKKFRVDVRAAETPNNASKLCSDLDFLVFEPTS